jgi:hypothetical protein
MAKRPSAGSGRRSSAVRDESPAQQPKRVRRFRRRVGPPILYPTEPSTIGDEKIAAAIDAIIVRKKQRL